MAVAKPGEKSIFNAARRIGSPEDRRVYLARACGEDRGLRARVEALLRAHEEHSTFLRSPAVCLPIVPDELAGDPGTVDFAGQDVAAEVGAPPIEAPPGYELLGEVGRGGMGVVYRARDSALDRDVAVKLLASRYTPGSAAARRFLDEARITGQLQHPGIPAVHQVGALSDGRPFLAMKLIKGQTFDDLLGGRADPAADRGQFLAVFEQVCQAVAYAHAHHVIHRDLKPSNVMVGAFGEVQVMDWGLAKVLTGRGVEPPDLDPDATTLGTEIRPTRGADAATQAGSLLGTPAFMAPEQAIGAVDRIDERSDVFGLGGILCAILTGQPPYVGDTAESTRQLAARAELDDARARLAASGAETELVALCERCLAPEPADRPRHGGEVADAVGRLRADAEDRARQAEISQARAEVRAAEEHKRRRAQLAYGGLVSLVLLAGGGLAGWQWRQAEQARDDTQDALTDVKEEQGRTLTALEAQKKQTALADGRLVALNRETANLYLTQGQSLCEQGESARGLHWLARGYQHAGSAGLVDVRDTAWEMLSGWTRDVHPLKAVIPAGNLTRAALSPDGTRVLTGSKGGMVSFWDAGNGERVSQPGSHGGDVTAVAFSADGRKAVTGGTNGVARMWDVATGRAIGSPMRHGAEVQGVAFSPDGRKLITGGKDRRARLWDAATGKPLNVVLVHRLWVPAVAFSPDGSKVLTGSWDHTAQLWDAETGARVGEPLVLPQGLIHAIAFSPDGKRFLTGTLRGEVAMWETDTHRLAGPVLQHAAAVHALAFSPDGRLVLTGSRDGTSRLWDAVTGKPVGPTLRHRSTVTGVGFAPDGRTMLTAGVGTGAFVWEITAPPPATHLRRGAMFTALDMTRDGRYVTAGGTDTTATLWDATTGQTVGEPLRLGGRACAVAFSPDGRTVAVGDDGGSVRLFSVPDAKPTGVAIGTGSATALAFSPDGSTLLTCDTTDKEVRFWDPSSGRRVGNSLRHPGQVQVAVFSPDGSKVATSGSDRSVRAWDARTGEPVGGPLLPQGRVLSLAFSPDGSRLLAGGDMWGSPGWAAHLWDVSTGRLAGPPLIHPSSVTDLAFHPDGRRVLTGCEDGAGRLWDTATGQPVGPPLQHSAPVHAVRFSPDGRIAVTGSHDNSVRLWDAHTGRPAGPALTYVAPVKWLLFDPDGRRLLAGSVTSQTATVWHLPVRTPPRPADEVTARVQAITGAEMDENGTFHVLGAADWTRRRAQVAGQRDQANPAPATAAPPTTAGTYHSLGLALHKKGSVDQAIEAYRKAIQLDPAYAPAYSSLGAALRAKRDSDGEIAAYREAVRHEVNSHPIYTRLAILLVERSEPREALGVLQRGARVNPGWLADPTTFFRYNSACCACLTAAGQGKNVPPSDERQALRRQALDWLTADLAAWQNRLAADPAKNRAAIHRRIAHWLKDADLASVRERAELEKLPLDERVGWVKLWTEVRDLRDATAPLEVSPPPRPVK